MNSIVADGRLTLQLRTSGGWKNVIHFSPERRGEITKAVGNFASILRDAPWCIRHPSGHRELLPLSGICRECGCTEMHACEGGCSWAEPGLCSACAPAKSRNRA